MVCFIAYSVISVLYMPRDLVAIQESRSIGGNPDCAVRYRTELNCTILFHINAKGVSRGECCENEWSGVGHEISFFMIPVHLSVRA